MLDDEIRALAARLGLSRADRRAIEALVLKAAASAPPTSAPTVILEAEATDPAIAPTSGAGARYCDIGPLGTGGMGEVRRVRDGELLRDIAMKVLKAELATKPGIVKRFIGEARTTSQLEHPNIVPVHDVGRLRDGRAFFTMKEVRGRTLTRVIAAVHAASTDTWGVTPDGWTFRRLIDAFHKACMAVAYAHARGVVHRDLKPDNIMVGRYGEVLVMDWGLARVIDRQAAEPIEVGTQPITRGGRVVGTPAYMSPEQAYGEGPTPAADVYALGSVLYEILSGHAPFDGEANAVVRRIRRGERPPPVGQVSRGLEFAETRKFSRDELTHRSIPPAARTVHPDVPAALAALCERAMAPTPDQRFRTADALADALAAWLDGAQRTQQAEALVEQASGLLPRAAELRTRAAELREQAVTALAELETWTPSDDKLRAWALQDEAGDLEEEADLLEVDAEGLLRGALSHAPGLSTAHAALADRQQQQHAALEASGQEREARKAELLLRAHALALPDSHPDRSRHFAYLRGDGLVDLDTEPSGAAVRLYRYIPRKRRLEPVFEYELGPTPLVAEPLAMGSYVLEIEAPGRALVRYPLDMRRQGRWTNVPPGATEGHPVHLPEADALGPDTTYVPASWFRAGGYRRFVARRLWCDAFAIQTRPVTNRAYLLFLNELVASDRTDEAERHVPRDKDPLYGRTEDGGFELIADEEGDIWEPDWPVIFVSWSSARAYAAWWAERTGQPWRLPSEWEWEKAARGVDGRAFPWGDHGEPSWFCNQYAFAGRPLPVSVDAYPVDESPYGVRHVAGNVSEWCLEPYHGPLPEDGAPVGPSEPEPGDEQYRTLRGGSWLGPIDYGRTCQRLGAIGTARSASIGFRLARSLGEVERSQ